MARYLLNTVAKSSLMAVLPAKIFEIVVAVVEVVVVVVAVVVVAVVVVAVRPSEQFRPGSSG